MNKYIGVSLSSGYVLKFDTMEDIAEHIESNLLQIADIEEEHGNDDRVNECEVSLKVLEKYVNDEEDFTLDNLNEFCYLIEYEYDIDDRFN